MFPLDEKIMEVLATAHVTSMLLPMIFAHIAPLATSDPRVRIIFMLRSVYFKFVHLLPLF